jgi:glycosyltransferase involved in cell wall biosynthesis
MISVVIPAYNEEKAIGAAVDDVRAALAGAAMVVEILVVDDGSSDGTARAAERSGARVVRHAHNLGYGYALKVGIESASHDTIVIMDGDGTYRASDIPPLVGEFEKGVDMVVGVRAEAALHETTFKRLLRAVLTFLVEFTVGRKVPDVNSGLRVFRRSAARQHFPRLCGTFSFTTSLTLAYMMTGRFVSYVPIHYSERVGRTKVKLFRDALRTLQYIVEAIVYFNPIKMFLLVAAADVLVAVIIAAGVAHYDRGASAIILGVAAASACVIFSIGLLADLVRHSKAA